MTFTSNKHPDWPIMPAICTVLSCVLSIAGFFAMTYGGFFIGGLDYNLITPYRDLGALLILSGIISLILALAVGKNLWQEENNETILE
jgi:uncharacterized membrane protein HdeD (DUF308 family)